MTDPGRLPIAAGRIASLCSGTLLLVVAVLALAVADVARATPDAYGDLLPELRGEVSAETAGKLNTYDIDATLDAAAGTIAATARVTFVNDAETPLNEVYFRLYPNAAYYDEGGLTVDSVQVGGVPVVPGLEVEETALSVPLSEPVVPGETVAIELAFATTVPVDSAGSYGIFRRDTADGTWILADWHPVLAVYEDGVGWRIDPPTSFGDPTFAASALYDVTLAAPADLIVVTSGVTAEERSRGELVERRYVAGPAREFTLVADDDYASVTAEVDGTRVTAYAEPDPVASAAAHAALDVAVRALDVYGQRFGAYPFAELDLVQTRLSGALAVSWSGIIFLDGPTLLAGYATTNVPGFETVVAHEVAHLWWGASVGSNSNDHTFINEGLATASSIVYLEATAGDDVAGSQLTRWVLAPARTLLERGDAVVDLPIADGQDPTIRSWAYYAKAALGFLALRKEVGDEAFFAGLRDFAETHRFGIAEPDDLLAAFETASGEELDRFWRHWFEATELTAEEIEALTG